MKIRKPYIIFLMGPTCIGKTNLAIEIAKRFPIEIISVDTGMIYRDMNIGTNKLKIKEQTSHPHYLIDIRNPSENYSIGDFVIDSNIAIRNIIKKNKVPILVGGSVLYFKTLYNGLISLPNRNMLMRKYIQNILSENSCKNLNHKLRKFHNYDLIVRNEKQLERLLEIYLLTRKFFKVRNKKKNSISSFNYNIIPINIKTNNRFLLNKSIKVRFMEMLEKGFVKEVQFLLHKYKVHNKLESMKCIGYKQALSYVNNECSYKSMIERSIFSTRQLVKKQLNWLNKWNNLIELDLDIKKKNDIFKLISKYFK